MTDVERNLLNLLQCVWVDEFVIAEHRKTVAALVNALQAERMPQELRDRLREAYRASWLADRHFGAVAEGVPDALMRKLRAEWRAELEAEAQ